MTVPARSLRSISTPEQLETPLGTLELVVGVLNSDTVCASSRPIGPAPASEGR